MRNLGSFHGTGAHCRPDGIGCSRGFCNPAPILASETRASSTQSVVVAVPLVVPWANYPLVKAMDEMRKTEELTALRQSLTPLVSNLEETLDRLPEAERTSYERAEQSVVDARRKAETHEGLLQVN